MSFLPHLDRPFAVLHRESDPGTAEILTGDVVELDALADLPVAPDAPPLLAAVPFRQVRERGFDAVDDGAPLLALRVTGRERVPLADLVAALPAGPTGFTPTGYDVPDEEYERLVTTVLAEEIGAGAGSNFVLHRALTGQVPLPPAQAALIALRRLLTAERRAYWTFALHTPELTMVGASPERHVSLIDGTVTMNPISGTLRYPPGGFASQEAASKAVLAFLGDEKERDELAMVVDEELKMMAVVGDLGGRVHGPYLKEMAHLAHTEYVLAGRTTLDVRDVVRATMFAPTVVGSPIRNACRVIARHERRGRGHYGGVLALIDHDEDGAQRLDAPILIRTAYLTPSGDGADVKIPAGATLVRGSVPASELAETRAKAAGILAAFTDPVAGLHDHGGVHEVPGDHAIPLQPLTADPRVAAELARRNLVLSRFWLDAREPVAPSRPLVTVIDAEDDFTAMLAHVLRASGHPVEVVPWDGFAGAAGPVVRGPVVLGPGPGDPADQGDPRIAVLHAIARERLDADLPTLGICLGHQVLASELGLVTVRLPVPDQGVQTEVNAFGAPARVGFYNSFVVAPPRPGQVPGLKVSADATGTHVVTMRGVGFAGMQFHPESVLTAEGPAILASELDRLCR